LCVSAVASASTLAPFINVGEHDLPENSSGIVRIYVEDFGAPPVSGFHFRGQIGDGLGSNPEPVFSSFDFTGGIWDAYANSSTGGPVATTEQLGEVSVVFDDQTNGVIPNGLLITIVIDTTGFVHGESFDLMLVGTDVGDSYFDGVEVPFGGTPIIDPVVINGTINIVPEPATMVLLAFGGLAMLKRRKRRA